jgi:hypothetical protein
VNIKIAIETCESLFALTVAVNDMANRSIQSLNAAGLTTCSWKTCLAASTVANSDLGAR